MKKRTFNLVVGITGGVATIASAVVTYAVTEICSLFVKTEK